MEWEAEGGSGGGFDVAAPEGKAGGAGIEYSVRGEEGEGGGEFGGCVSA